MATPHAGACLPVDLRPQGETLSEHKSHALVKNSAFEAIRVVIPKDHEVCHEHHMEGPITMQCLEGWISFTADGDKHSLKAGQWTYLPPGVRHTITGVENSMVLLTIIFP
jgi:quercetin dioxygenase-like cupin family protein